MAANQTVSIHGRIPPSFMQDGVIEHKKVTYGLNFPLGENKKYGGFFQKVTGVNLIKDAVHQLLLTERGERVLLPKYGCNLRKYLFQPLEETTFESIKEEILFSFERYIVGARILKLSVRPTEEIGPTGGNALRIVLLLQLVQEDLTVFDVEVQIK
jgi:phage baseplate assembly protein W